VTNLTAVVVDDEALARERLRTLLQAEPNISVVAECANGTDAIDVIRLLCPSIVFLDVQMPAVGAFEVLAALTPDQRPPAVIFVTAYDRYAVRAFEINAVDYLMKPYTRDRFVAALERARSRLALHRDLRDCGECRLSHLCERDAKTRPDRAFPFSECECALQHSSLPRFGRQQSFA
jgi:two-component system LytT family response regulator